MVRMLLQRTNVWLGVAGGCFAITGLVYLQYGFGYGFLPLLCGIYAARRWLLVRTAAASHKQSQANTDSKLAERYDIDPDREYTAAEQTDVLTDLRSEYRSKRISWGVLGVFCIVVGLGAIFVSLLVSVCSAGLAAYCGVRCYRTWQIVMTLDRRLQTLADAFDE